MLIISVVMLIALAVFAFKADCKPVAYFIIAGAIIVLIVSNHQPKTTKNEAGMLKLNAAVDEIMLELKQKSRGVKHEH